MEPSFKKIDHFYYDPNSKYLGKGAFAAVYKAIDERTNTTVAVKVVPSVKLLESEEQYNLFMREINVLRQIKGEHIVCLLDVKRTTNNLYIFTDFCDGGDLEKKIKSKHLFTEEEACSILKQIADAFVTIEGLHLTNSKGQPVVVMHRDIKAANILFHEGRVKVADFGFAKFIEEANKNLKQKNTLLGTPLYMAPQILNDESYSSKCDLWSTGVLFYELLFGKLPWTGTSVPNLYNNIKSKPLTFPKDVSNETKDLLTKMLKVREEDRITWKGVYEHPALKKIDIKKEANQKKIASSPYGTVQQTASPFNYGQQMPNHSPQQGGYNNYQAPQNNNYGPYGGQQNNYPNFYQQK